MSRITRFGVALEKAVLKEFDRQIRRKKYPNRSKAISDLIRTELVKEEWSTGKEVAGVISLVYNHHKRELVNKLIDVQHDFHQLIISVQHIHLDESNCLEIAVVKGKPGQVQALADLLKGVKGVKYGTLTMATTGKEI